MTSDISIFFSRSTHCSPAVVEQLRNDIDQLVREFGLCIRRTAWGNTQQDRICIFGGLILRHSLTLPIQIWLTHYYPIEPPTLFAVAPSMSYSEDIGVSRITTWVYPDHPNMDNTGLCYCAALSKWNPRSASLVAVLRNLITEINKNGYPLEHQSSQPTLNNLLQHRHTCIVCFTENTTSSVVFIPCGHCCTCSSCASSLHECPVCRITIQLRQPLLYI